MSVPFAIFRKVSQFNWCRVSTKNLEVNERNNDVSELSSQDNWVLYGSSKMSLAQWNTISFLLINCSKIVFFFYFHILILIWSAVDITSQNQSFAHQTTLHMQKNLRRCYVLLQRCSSFLPFLGHVFFVRDYRILLTMDRQ